MFFHSSYTVAIRLSQNAADSQFGNEEESPASRKVGLQEGRNAGSLEGRKAGRQDGRMAAGRQECRKAEKQEGRNSGLH